ncbi:hypothetical protein KNE206_56840 [Kitasatospora sp. NE20-6]|uniref:hypothetical protein n=1 Tax=Kitasatospora sp. NE20-6 TaxID=2859066 RepID=UPI0034DC60C2
MGIGYLLLYAALVVVALWLVAELLLQNRAPLVWRGTALGGFLTVVAGMALQSVLVIGAGAAAFAVGQVFVTASVKRGVAVGRSLRGPDGSLPAPLARIPLLAAATGGAAGAPDAAGVPVPVVGEVGPVEPERPGAAYAEVEEIAADDGVYTEQPWQQEQVEQQQVWPYQQPAQQDAYGQQAAYAQQAAYGYDQGQAQGQTWQQTAYQDQYGQVQYAQVAYPQNGYAQPGYEQQYAPYAQDGQPYAQYPQDGQYQQAYQQPQQGWEQPAAVPQQQPYAQPQAPVPQQQAWDYQQQG